MLKDDLQQFYGTEHYYRLTPNVVITDGVKYFADKAEAYWLITDIAIITTTNKQLKDNYFIVIKTRKKDNGGIIVQYEDGNYNPLYIEEYPIADLPDDGEFNIWKESNVLLLPSEH